MLSHELATELRAARPSASAELRERVLEIAARGRPARSPRVPLLPLRRVALVAAPVAGGSSVAGQLNAPLPLRAGVGKDQALTGKQPFSTALPNTTSRLQQYGAFM